MKKRIQRLLNRTGVGHRAISDRRFRVSLLTGIGLSLNLLYALCNGVLGVLSGSTWFAVLCVYYLTLCAMRFSLMPRRGLKAGEHGGSRLLLFNGVVMIALAFVLACIVLVSLRDNVRSAYPQTVMIGIAAYTFSVTVLAVINFVKAQIERSAFLITVRNISLAAATASMLSLERSMVSTFSERDGGLDIRMDACTGAGGFLIVLALGVSMLVMGCRKRRAAKEAKEK